MTAVDGNRDGDWLREWDRVNASAAKAHDSLLALLRRLGGGGFRTHGSRALEPPLRQMMMTTPGQQPSDLENPDLDVVAASVAAKADALSLALAITEELRHFAGGRRDSIATARRNPGDPAKNAFVRVIAEAWVFLTDELPGKGSERGNFLRFVPLAWEDVGGKDTENFTQAIRKALEAPTPLTVTGIPPLWS